MTHVLHVNSSARSTDSVTRALGAQVIDALRAQNPQTTVSNRDLTQALPQIDEAWVTANFTPADQRTDDQGATLAQSDSLVRELQAADTIVIGLPIYNFGVPAALKAWIDLVARAGVTFRYTANGPEGLLEGKSAIVVVASGGTKLGSEFDFATGHLRQVLSFIGIDDVTFISADQLAVDRDATILEATNAITQLAA